MNQQMGKIMAKNAHATCKGHGSYKATAPKNQGTKVAQILGTYIRPTISLTTSRDQVNMV